MALSEYERKMLEELEAQLSDEDPGFADTLKPKPSPKAAARQVSILEAFPSSPSASRPRWRSSGSSGSSSCSSGRGT